MRIDDIIEQQRLRALSDPFSGRPVETDEERTALLVVRRLEANPGRSVVLLRTGGAFTCRVDLGEKHHPSHLVGTYDSRATFEMVLDDIMAFLRELRGQADEPIERAKYSASAEAKQLRHAAIRRMHQGGFSRADIALRVGVSVSLVRQVIVEATEAA